MMKAKFKATYWKHEHAQEVNPNHNPNHGVTMDVTQTMV